MKNRTRTSSYEVDIGEEFKNIKHDLKTEISTLGTKIQALESKFDKFITSFEEQLKTLNSNMSSVLNTLANHEARLTALEQSQKTAKIKKDTLAEIWKKTCVVGQWLFQAGLVLAAAGGISWAVKLINVMGNR